MPRAGTNAGKTVSGTVCAKHPAGRPGKRFLTPFSPVGRFFGFEERGASLRGEGRRVHVLVHVIAAGIVLGYAALKIVSYLDSKGAGPQ